MANKKTPRFKSGFEKTVATAIGKKHLEMEYEPTRFQFQTITHYTPDFRIGKDKYIETKGYFTPSNRGKLLSFREQYPHVTIYLLFQNSNNTLGKKSKTTYGQWASRHDFKWADYGKHGIPKEWWA